MATLKSKCLEFMAKDPNQDEIEKFYIDKVMPYSKLSINEIINE